MYGCIFAHLSKLLEPVTCNCTLFSVYSPQWHILLSIIDNQCSVDTEGLLWFFMFAHLYKSSYLSHTCTKISVLQCNGECMSYVRARAMNIHWNNKETGYVSEPACCRMPTNGAVDTRTTIQVQIMGALIFVRGQCSRIGGIGNCLCLDSPAPAAAAHDPHS